MKYRRKTKSEKKWKSESFAVFNNFLSGQKKFLQRKVFFYSAYLNEDNNYTITKNNEVIHNI